MRHFLGAVSKNAWFVCLVLVSLSGVAVSGEDGDQHTIENFILQDQHKQKQDIRFPREKITVLIAADEEGSRQIEPWLTPLKERCGPHVDLVGVAEVSSVPALLRNRVRKSFAEKWQHPVLLDWKGEIVGSLGLKAGQVGLLVLDREGRVMRRESGAFTEDKMDRLLRALKEMKGDGTFQPKVN